MRKTEMRIAYLIQLHPTSTRTDITLPTHMAETMANRGHRVLVIVASDRDYSYHIYRNNIIILQLRSFKCPLFIGQQPLFLPFPIIFQALYNFQPDILYMDKTNSMN
jgi:hypothetical protein